MQEYLHQKITDFIKIMAYRAQLYPHTAERNYQRLLIGVVNSMDMNYLKRLDLLRMDGWSDDLTAAIEYLLSLGLAAGRALTIRLPEVYAQVNQFQDRQWRLVTKAGTGLEIGPSATLPAGSVPYGNVSAPGKIRARFGVGVDVYRSEPWLAARQKNWVAQNAALIKSIPEQHMARVESIIRSGVMAGESPKSLAAKIQEAGGVTKRRATLIARDQIGKANAELTQYRQMDLVIKDYTWITSHDERVRSSHRVRDGVQFSWDKPPEDGHPGMPIQCRCHASPIFPD